MEVSTETGTGGSTSDGVTEAGTGTGGYWQELSRRPTYRTISNARMPG